MCVYMYSIPWMVGRDYPWDEMRWFGTLNTVRFSCLWDQGGSVGVQFGSILGVFDPYPVTPVRARAYNDLSKVPVLPKTRSSGGLDTPELTVFWTLQIYTLDRCWHILSERIPTFMVCTAMC